MRRIFCVGRNSVEHGHEMGGIPKTEPPFFFPKPADAMAESGKTTPFPQQTANLRYEGKLVVALSRGGSDVAERTRPR